MKGQISPCSCTPRALEWKDKSPRAPPAPPPARSPLTPPAQRPPTRAPVRGRVRSAAPLPSGPHPSLPAPIPPCLPASFPSGPHPALLAPIPPSLPPGSRPLPGRTWALEPSSGGRRAPTTLAVVCRLTGALCGGSAPIPPCRVAVTIAMGARAGSADMGRLCPGLPPGLPPPGALRRAGTTPGLALPLAPLPTSTASFCRERGREKRHHHRRDADARGPPAPRQHGFGVISFWFGWDYNFLPGRGRAGFLLLAREFAGCTLGFQSRGFGLDFFPFGFCLELIS